MADKNIVQVFFEASIGNFRRNINLMRQQLTSFGNKGQEELNGVNKKLNQTGEIANKVKGVLKTLTAIYIGKKVFDFGAHAAVEFGKTQTALGEMSSLGYTDLETLRQAAIDFSNQWSGTTRDNFIASAYDIKSGIASLSDEGVAQFTKLAALTGKATKSTVDEMTTLFAQGYGIYRKFYNSDFDFGEKFSAGISKSVQQFRTTGTEMAGYLSTLGATAQKAGANLSEVLTLGGTLQATMSGSEAATKYASFLNGAMKASKSLGLSFVDNNNKLLPAVQIIETIKSKFGDTIDAVESAQLMEAFGRKEAVDFVKQLYDKTNDLKSAQIEVNNAIEQGTAATEEMAETMNKGLLEKAGLARQRFNNVFEKLGEKMEPSVTKAFDKIFAALDQIQQNGTLDNLANNLGNILSAVAGHADEIINTITRVVQYVSNHLPEIAETIKSVAAAWAAFKIVTAGAAIAQWALNVAMNANPIGLVITLVTGLIAAIVALYMKSETARKVITKVWAAIKIAFLSFVYVFLLWYKRIIEVWKTLVGWIPGLGDAIKGVEKVVDASMDKIGGSIKDAKDELMDLKEEMKDTSEQGQKLGHITFSNFRMAEKELYEQQGITLNSGKSTEDKTTDSMGNDSTPKTIKEYIREVDEDYQDEEDLYQSRIDLAEQKGNETGVKRNTNLYVQALKEKLVDYADLGQYAGSGKDKNILEVAKNKILLKIQRMVSSIEKGVQEVVGEFNKPSDLNTFTKYQYQVATSNNVLNKTMAVSPTMNMYLTLNDMDKKNADQVKRKADTFMNLVMGRNEENRLYADMISQVTRG